MFKKKVVYVCFRKFDWINRQAVRQAPLFTAEIEPAARQFVKATGGFLERNAVKMMQN